MNKKSVELAMNAIIIAVIVIIVAVIIIFVFQHYYGKETGFVGEQIDQLGDCDGDGTANMFDECPCDDGEPDEEGKCSGKRGKRWCFDKGKCTI